jgi:hypothetical protein
MEVLKFLTGIGTNLKGELLVCEGEEMRFRVFEIKRSPSCPACG